jgi:hypothetical protein
MFDNMTTIEVLKMFAPLIVIQFALIIFCLFKLIKDRVKYLPKWTWALIIILLNLIGPIFYLVIGRERD